MGVPDRKKSVNGLSPLLTN